MNVHPGTSTNRWAGSALVLGAAVLLTCGLSGCGSDAAPPVDFVPSLAASESPEGEAGSAPTLPGVPPCPSSDADAAEQGGVPALPSGEFECLTEGPAVNLAGLRGVPTVVTIWASWCEPCRREIPFFVDLQKRAGTQVRVLGIDVLDRAAPARAAVEDFGMNFPSVRDPEGVTKKTVGYPGPPVTLFVDDEGAITYRKVGPVTTQQQLDDLVDEHLGVQVS
jgi:cytochrome c biogenesis protein CcmG/thiol:disulfide interchange protein DsbE